MQPKLRVIVTSIIGSLNILGCATTGGGASSYVPSLPVTRAIDGSTAYSYSTPPSSMSPVPLSPSSTSSFTEPEKKVALVIGNSNYINTAVLSNAGNDARDLADALRNLGFEVEELIDAKDQRAMRDAVTSFGKKLGKSAIGMFFYAGHGIQVNGENYLVPIDATLKSQADVDYEVLNVKYIQDILELAENDMNVIVLDACRNNPFTRNIRVASRSVVSPGLAKMDSVKGSLVAFATSPGSTASDGDSQDKNGVYTKNLLQHIKTPGLKIEELFKKVRIGVSNDTQNEQIPWESSSLTGDFCFAGCTDATAQAAATVQETQLKNILEQQTQELQRQKAALAEAEAQAKLQAEAAEIERAKLARQQLHP